MPATFLTTFPQLDLVRRIFTIRFYRRIDSSFFNERNWVRVDPRYCRRQVYVQDLPFLKVAREILEVFDQHRTSSTHVTPELNRVIRILDEEKRIRNATIVIQRKYRNLLRMNKLPNTLGGKSTIINPLGRKIARGRIMKRLLLNEIINTVPRRN
jgi:hypothetical protein